MDMSFLRPRVMGSVSDERGLSGGRVWCTAQRRGLRGEDDGSSGRGGLGGVPGLEEDNMSRGACHVRDCRATRSEGAWRALGHRAVTRPDPTTHNVHCHHPLRQIP